MMYNRRLKIMLAILSGAALAVVVRLIDLQAVHAKQFQQRAAEWMRRPSRLIPTVRGRIVDRHGRVLAENRRLRAALADVPQRRLVGESPPIEAMRHRMAQVAATSATLLVQGESGTGKELVAVEIHHASDRADGPFVKLNCASLSATLTESELFGHEKGAFTGADQTRRGRFEIAHGGSLWLT